MLQMEQEDEKPVLLAVGGLGPYEHVRIGSVPDKLMRAARGPFPFIPWHGTAKAREDGLLSNAEKERVEVSEHQTKILVATDGSKASFHAAERAVHLAGHLRAKLYVLYAVDKDRAFHAGIHYGEDLRELEKAGKEATEKVAALAEKHGLECEKLVVEGGRAARTIVWEAQEVGADYIVMGAEGMSRLESIIIGNVAQEVLRRADRTVLLVGGHRSPDDPMLSPRSECTDPEVALAEHEASSETPEKKVVE